MANNSGTPRPVPSRFISRKIIFYDNFLSFWKCHSKQLYQFGHVIPNIHVTLDISCHFKQCHKKPYFLLDLGRDDRDASGV